LVRQWEVKGTGKISITAKEKIILSKNSSCFSGLLLVLIISITSSIGAFALTDVRQTRSLLAQAPVLLAPPFNEAAAFTSIQAASLATNEPVDASHEQLVGETWRRTELYFGTSKSDGSVVTAQEFQDFVDEIVTPRFPDGLTLLTGDGQWRNSAGVIIEEESNVLILLYPLDDKEATSEIEQIREAYKDAFQQESVLRVDDYSWVSF
jgi:hypothetical protein